MPRAVWLPMSAAPTSARAVASRIASITRLTGQIRSKIKEPHCWFDPLCDFSLSFLDSQEESLTNQKGGGSPRFPPLARARHYSTGRSLRAVLQAASRATKRLDQPEPLVMNMRGAPFDDSGNSSGQSGRLEHATPSNAPVRRPTGDESFPGQHGCQTLN